MTDQSAQSKKTFAAAVAFFYKEGEMTAAVREDKDAATFSVEFIRDHQESDQDMAHVPARFASQLREAVLDARDECSNRGDTMRVLNATLNGAKTPWI